MEQRRTRGQSLVKVKIYIEGGGQSHLQDVYFRKGWREFFAKAGFTERMPATVRGGGRDQTYNDFCRAVANPTPNVIPLLLVDSEEILQPQNAESWNHLQQRDGWNRPNGAEDAFLMICCMETWFVADRQSLAIHFGPSWRPQAIPAWQNLERVDKQRIFSALDGATLNCGKNRYAKGDLSFKLLSVIDPAVVREQCSSADALLTRLNELLG